MVRSKMGRTFTIRSAFPKNGIVKVAIMATTKQSITIIKTFCNEVIITPLMVYNILRNIYSGNYLNS